MSIDEQAQVENSTPAQSPEQIESETPTEETTPSVEDASVPQETPDAPEVEEPKKQTRAERRIQSLVSKLKERPQVQENFLQTPDEPLIRPEELESGLDPVELERRVANRVQNEGYKTRQQIKAEIAYETAVGDHQSDIESVAKSIDPKLEKIAVRQYEAINYQINPMTGQPVFIPTVKLSEVVQMLKDDMENITSDRVASASRDIIRAANESALPGSDAPINHSGDLMQKAISSGSDDDWKEVLKSRM